MSPPITNVYLQLVELMENYIISGFYGKITRCGSTCVYHVVEGKDLYIIVVVNVVNIRIHVWKLSQRVLLLSSHTVSQQQTHKFTYAVSGTSQADGVSGTKYV